APIGSDVEVHVDVRYIAATHRDLQERVANGQFRADLYQRIAGRVITIAPLRERRQDIVEIGLGFVDGYLEREPTLTDERERIAALLASPAFQSYRWPGNVRELENVLRDVLLGFPPRLGDEIVTTGTPLPAQPSWGRRAQALPSLPAALRNGEASLEEVEAWYLRTVLSHNAGNYTRAAEVLGIDRSTLRRLLRA
ncbi:MAG TPA: sigma 54-interacting transcriptional regulator, partial [Polyangiales bacterium]|nr:sigma 54-interacting transcriptional regulator [Polyangiales bacterium]